jgi:hypothetical protein
MIRDTAEPLDALHFTNVYGILVERTHNCQLLPFAEVMTISHHRVNRFFYRKSYTGQDLFNEVSSSLSLIGSWIPLSMP